MGSVAIVQDTTYFGATAPLMGLRSRFEVGFSRGSLKYQTLLLDWRRYYMPVGPVTIAVRGMHYGRYGADSDNPRLIGLYAGYPEFVHGYGVGSFSPVECPSVGGRRGMRRVRPADWQPDGRRQSSRFARRCGHSSRGSWSTAAFRSTSPLSSTWAWPGTKPSDPSSPAARADIVKSVGAAVRINVFGLLPVEVSAAHPFDRVDRSLQWQIGIRQGF